MSRSQLLGLVMAACVLVGCGGSGTETKADSPKAEAPAATPTPTFSVAAWNQAWNSAKEKYLFALQGFNNQIDLLNRSNATDEQFAMVVTTNSRKIANAARALARQLEQTPIPAERADLQQAVDNLRAALLNEEKAYRTSAGCRRDLECLEAARPAVVQAARQSGAALAAMPTA